MKLLMIYIIILLFFIGIFWFFIRKSPKAEYGTIVTATEEYGTIVTATEEYEPIEYSKIYKELKNKNIIIPRINPDSISGGEEQPVQYIIKHDESTFNIKILLDESNFESNLKEFTKKLLFFEVFITTFFFQNAKHIQNVGFQEAYIKSFQRYLKKFNINVDINNKSDYSAQRNFFYYYLDIFLHENPSFIVIDDNT
jgi:hypothetical protein